MELISVIVPIYKVEQYMDRCVESLVHQTYTNLEIILVDDGSPDGCPAMCDEWAEKDSRIRAIHKVNGGLSDARNAGMAVATGEYIGFVDSDDWVEPGFYQTLYDLLQAHDADIAECGVNFIDENGKLLRQRQFISTDKAMLRVDAIKHLLKEDGIYQTVWNKLYRRETIGGILFEKGRLHEDDFWTYQIFDRAKKLAVTQQPMYNYFQRSDSIMGVGYRLKNLDGLEARHRQVDFFSSDPELADFVKARVLYNDMYHFQAALKYLKQPEQKAVTDYICEYVKTLGCLNYKGSDVPYKYQLWFAAFRKFPFAVSKIRNLLGIG